MRRQTALWAIAAVLGIVLVAAVTWATSQLTSQRIGLASEPLSAGRRLAPPVAERAVPRRWSPRAPAHTTTSHTRAPSATSPASTPTSSSTASPNSTTTSRESAGSPEAEAPRSAPATPVEAEPTPTAKSAPQTSTASSGARSRDDGGDHEGRNGREASPSEATGRRDD